MSEALSEIFARIDARRPKKLKNPRAIESSPARKRHRTAPRPRPTACEVCGGAGRNGLVFDHCHRSGAFRGWLCDGCNIALGAVRDDPARLLRLAQYLRGA